MTNGNITIEDLKSRRDLAKKFGMKPQQIAFADYYRVDRNGTQAALSAYPKLNRRSARQRAYDLLAIEGIRSYIEALDLYDALKTNQDAADVIEEYKAIAFFNPADVLDNKWNLKDLNKIPRSAMACIKSVQHGKDGISVTFYDKLTALKSMGQLHKLWSEKFTLDVGDLSLELVVSDERSPFADEDKEEPTSDE